MSDTKFEKFRKIANNIAVEMSIMSYLWEQMQFDDEEPGVLGFSNEDYPFEKSFDDVASGFWVWVESLNDGNAVRPEVVRWDLDDDIYWGLDDDIRG